MVIIFVKMTQKKFNAIVVNYAAKELPQHSFLLVMDRKKEQSIISLLGFYVLKFLKEEQQKF